MEVKPYIPLRRSWSLPLLPPDLSELRVVLFGNSWIQRCYAGNILLKETKFKGKRQPKSPVRESGELQEKEIHVIISPDLLQPNLTEDRLTELVTETAEACSPGPHVFLLVLQPEDFTEQHKTRLESVLKRFGEQAFDRSLVLMSTPREQTPDFMDKYVDVPHLRDMIIKCRYEYLWMNITEFDQNLNFKHKNLLSRIIKIVNEQEGNSLPYKSFEASEFAPPSKKMRLSHVTTVKAETTAGLDPSKEFTIMLFGKSDGKKTKLTNFLTGAQTGAENSVVSGEWRGNHLTVVKTPDLSSVSVKSVREEIKRCVSLCNPGPNVLLLLVKPSDFTQNDREKLKSILNHFGPNAFKHSMVILTHKEKTNTCVDELIGDCEGRHYNMTEKDLDQFMGKIELIVHKNQSFLTFTEEKKPCLNLVLCGRTRAGKTSVAQSILGQAAFPTPGQCVKHEGEVCGRWVSLVELPDLSGKPPETVVEQCLHCISLCGPEGVHAFILVLPVGPLTDKDKTELKIIQDCLSLRVQLFSIILFAVDSDPDAPAVVNFVRGDRDLQELYEPCGGGHFIFNTRDQQPVSELLDYVEKLRAKNEPKGFTTETLVQGQFEKVMAQLKEIHNLKSMSSVSSKDNQSPDCLRIVLIGKTGSGKSSSGNTIVGEKQFTVKRSRNSVTKFCTQKRTKVDGRSVAVVDTPGLFDTNLSHDEVNKEMVKCISLLAPGPHVFLLVIKIDRFTTEQREAVQLIKEGFGKDADRFIIVLFTHGDELEEDNMSIEQYIEEGGYDSFNQLLSDCGNRYHVFNNRNKTDRTQVQELLQKIDDMVKENAGRYYTNDMLQEAEAAINKETKRLLQEKEEEMKKEKEEMERKHKQAMEEIKQKMDKQKEKFEKKKLEQVQLKEKFKEEKEEQKREKEKREEEERIRREQDEQKRQEWERNYKELEEKIKAAEKSNKIIESKLQKSRRQKEKEKEQREKEKEEWWKQRKLEDEERRKAEKQKQEQYEEEREKLNKKLEQEQLRREEEEKKMKVLQEEYQTKLEEMEKEKEKYKEEARIKAEELNDFQKKLNHEFEERKQEYERSIKDKDEKYDLLKALAAHNERQKISDIVRCVSKKPDNVVKLHILLNKHKEKMKRVKDEEKGALLKAQEKELEELIQNLLTENDKSICVIV